jgi:hypothetical protein
MIGGIDIGAYGSVYGMEKTTVYLTSEQKRALERTARATGRSEAELIRDGIERVTQAVAEPRLPLFESGRPDLAEHADDELAGFGER